MRPGDVLGVGGGRGPYYAVRNCLFRGGLGHPRTVVSLTGQMSANVWGEAAKQEVASMDADQVASRLTTVGLDPSVMNRYPHEFSGGQRQRIGIARALALKPKLIVADEPVSALDVSIQAQIINLLADLQQEFGLTYLFISHAIPVIEYISTRIGVMYLGKLVEVGTSAQICLAPKHPYTQALLSAVPVPDPAAKKQRIVLRGDVPTAINPPSGCRFHTRCPIAVDRCKIEEPPLRQLEDGRDVACHLV